MFGRSLYSFVIGSLFLIGGCSGGIRVPRVVGDYRFDKDAGYMLDNYAVRVVGQVEESVKPVLSLADRNGDKVIDHDEAHEMMGILIPRVNRFNEEMRGIGIEGEKVGQLN